MIMQEKGKVMEERRKAKRTGMLSRLVIQKVEGRAGQEATIDVVDLSKSGVGFTCQEPLQIGEVYEAYLTIWTKEVIHAFLRIVRIEMKEKNFGYGAVFVGMPVMESSRIETYQTINDNAGTVMTEEM